MKKLIRAAWTGRHLDGNQLTRTLLQYRNTPSRKDGLSPAEKLYGHPIQDTLPAHRRAFLAKWQRNSSDVERRVVSTQEAVEESNNLHARPLPEINIGSRVALQSHETKCWDIYSTVTDMGQHMDYFIKTQSGRVSVRNRRFIRCRTPVSVTYQEPDPAALCPPQHAPSRRACRHRKATQHLIKDIHIFSFQSNDNTTAQETLGGGDVGN